MIVALIIRRLPDTEDIYGNFKIAAAFSSILTIITVVSLLIFMKVSKSDDIMIEQTNMEICIFMFLFCENKKFLPFLLIMYYTYQSIFLKGEKI